MSQQESRPIARESNRQDPYFQYLKYGSYFLFRDGIVFPEMGVYQEILKEKPEPELYRTCWRNFQEGRDLQAREKLILWNMKIVYVAACFLMNQPVQNMELEDLMSYGCYGLIQALENYREGMGKEFSNYAFVKILRHMWKGLENQGINRSRYRAGRIRFYSLDTEDKHSPIQRELRRIAYDRWGKEEETRFTRLALSEELNRLEKMERTVIQMVYLNHYSQVETARKLKISRYEARKLQEEALEKLQKNLKNT